MVGPKQDLVGVRFGKITALRFAYRKKRKSMWLCLCDCGATKFVYRNHLLRGAVVSCGCKKKQRSPILQRLMQKVSKNKKTNCWEWRGAFSSSGYGYLTIRGKSRKDRRSIFAHRLSYEAHKGAIPDGLNICHRCDNKKCINPAHLFPGTQKENMADAKAKGRLKRRAVVVK